MGLFRPVAGQLYTPLALLVKQYTDGLKSDGWGHSADAVYTKTSKLKVTGGIGEINTAPFNTILY
jgi:hypothetical protein